MQTPPVQSGPAAVHRSHLIHPAARRRRGTTGYPGHRVRYLYIHTTPRCGTPRPQGTLQAIPATGYGTCTSTPHHAVVLPGHRVHYRPSRPQGTVPLHPHHSARYSQATGYTTGHPGHRVRYLYIHTTLRGTYRSQGTVLVHPPHPTRHSQLRHHSPQSQLAQCHHSWGTHDSGPGWHSAKAALACHAR